MLSHRLGNIRTAILCLVALAGLAGSQGKAERVARLWGAAESCCARTGMTIPPPTLARYEEPRSEARAELGEDAWTAAWGQGQAMSLEETIAYALDGRA
jgi:hypothetical protein